MDDTQTIRHWAQRNNYLVDRLNCHYVRMLGPYTQLMDKEGNEIKTILSEDVRFINHKEAYTGPVEVVYIVWKGERPNKDIRF